MRIRLVATAIVATQVQFAEADALQVGVKILEGVRGGWLGFNRGLYKRANSSPMNEACMNNESANNLTAAFHQFKHDDVVEGDWFDALGNLTKVAANMTNCNFRQPFRDIYGFCKEQHAEQKKYKEEKEAREKEKSASEGEEEDGNNEESGEDEQTKPIVRADKDDEGKYDFALDFEEELEEETKGCTIKGMLDSMSKNTFILMGKVSNASATIKNWDSSNVDALHNECLELGEDIGTFLRISLSFDP